VRSLPIRKDDEVEIVRGQHAKEAVSKVTSPYRLFQSLRVIVP
jgi:ribosomal protein L24